MKYTPTAFSTKWKQRFVPNDEFQITAADLQEFTQDTADSFGVSVANVPAYVAGTAYAVGYLVRFGSAQGRESFYYALKAGLLPAPTYQLGDTNWKLVPGPVPPTVFTQAITLLEAGGLEGAGVAVRLYAIEGSPVPGVSNPEVGCWNQDGQTRTIYVWGYENFWGKLGVLLDGDGRPQQEVEVDVAAGTYQTRVIGGGPGGSYSDQQAADAALAALIAGNGQHVGVQVSVVGGLPKLTVQREEVVRFSTEVAPGSGNLATKGHDVPAGGTGLYKLTTNRSNFSALQVIKAGPSTVYDGPVSAFPNAGVYLEELTHYEFTFTPVDATKVVTAEFVAQL